MKNAMVDAFLTLVAIVFIFIMSYAFALIGEPRSLWFIGLFGIEL